MAISDSGKQVRRNGAGSNGIEVSSLEGPPPVAAGGGDTGFKEISFRDMLDTLLKGKWSIISSFAIVLLSVAVYTFMQDPVYEAHSIVLIENTKTNQTQRIEDLITGQVNRNVYNEVEIIGSRRLARMVAQQALESDNFDGMPLVRPTEEGPPSVRLVTGRVLGMRDVRPLGREVDMIRITSTSTNPEEAAQVSNLLAEQYMSHNRLNSRRMMSQSKEFLQQQYENFSQDLAGIEDELQDFQQEAGVTINTEAEQLVNQIGTIESERDRTQIDLGMARSELEALRDQANQIEPGLAARMTSGIEDRIAAYRQSIQELEAEIDLVYAKNPELRGNESSNPDLMVKIQQRQAFSQQINELTDQYLEDIAELGGYDPTVGGEGNPVAYLMELRRRIAAKEIEVSGLEERAKILNERLNRYRGQLNRFPSKAIRQQQLVRSQEATLQTFQLVAQRLQEAQIAEQSELGYASIVDNAIVPRTPVRPKKMLNLVLGATFGLILGLCIVFLRNAMDNRIRKPEDLRGHGISVAGMVPDMEKVVRSDFGGKPQVTSNGTTYSTSLITLLNPLSPVSETYRRLRTNIQFSRPDIDIKTVLMTSAGPGEGKTITAANLAITMAQSGKRTLLLDCDLRRPTAHRTVGVHRDPGLVEILFDKFTFDSSQFATEIDDLYMIPSGSTVPNPAELMGSNKMKEFLTQLRDEFDYIVVDSPPINAVTDAVLLSRLVDGTLIVVSANETDWHSLDRALETLYGVDAYVIGTILNKFDVKRAYGYYGYRYSYGYGYGYGYYDYYGEKRQDGDGDEKEEGKKSRSRSRDTSTRNA